MKVNAERYVVKGIEVQIRSCELKFGFENAIKKTFELVL